MIVLKIHNVYHDEVETKPSGTEEYIKDFISRGKATNVRVAWGNTNSSVYIHLDESDLNINQIKEIAREALIGFQGKVRSIQVDNSITEKNIRIQKQ